MFLYFEIKAVGLKKLSHFYEGGKREIASYSPLVYEAYRKGDKVAILMMNCLEWLPVYFGILKAGCIAVPMNFRYASDEIKFKLIGGLVLKETIERTKR